MPRLTKSEPHFGPLRFLARLLFTFLIVFASYNPTGRSYVDWVLEEGSGPLPLQIVSGLLLAVGWVLLIRLATASFGRLRFLFSLVVIALFGLGLRALLADASDGGAIAVSTTLAILAAWLTVGLSWPALGYRLTGQRQTRKV